MQADTDILVVEDSATQSLRLQFYLQERGYAVATVPDGVEALLYLAEKRPRLVVCDVDMPRMDGYEFCRRVRNDAALSAIPVVLWTHLETPADTAQGLEAGAVAVVRKPLGDDVLHQAVQRLLVDAEAPARAVAGGYLLIVEDSPTQAAQLAETLRIRGYETDTAANGREALETIRRHRPALIVSDVRMPIVDGFQLCQAVKQEPGLRTIPVILLTSLSAPTDVLSALEAGADFHIPKPCHGDYLAERIAEILQRPDAAAAALPPAAEVVTIGDTTHKVSAPAGQVLRLLLSTYEVAFRKNQDLRRMREELQSLNETLEQKVHERTAALAAEVAERQRADEQKAALESQLRQAQKMESLGRLAGGVAHDFNNLLMGIMNYVQLCQDELPLEHPVRGYLEEIAHDAQRSAAITQQLLAYARRQAIAPEVLDLNGALASLLKMLQRVMGEDIAIVSAPGAGLWPVRMDPSQLSQVLVNLCANARDAIAGVGTVTITTENVTLQEGLGATRAGLVPGDYVLLAFSDDGRGMTTEVVDHIFEPFFTTKDVGKGTGLGLSTVYGIISQNAGGIDVASEPGQGTTFRLYLPRVTAMAEPARVAVVPTELPRGTETILVVEDEKSVRVTTCHFLDVLGYSVMAAATPAEALQLAGSYVGPIHLLITDVVMPGLSGHDLATALTATRPGLKRLFMSGYTAHVASHSGGPMAGAPFLSKPFSRSTLAFKVREIIDHDSDVVA